jgi:hypothetical protein
MNGLNYFFPPIFEPNMEESWCGLVTENNLVNYLPVELVSSILKFKYELSE